MSTAMLRVRMTKTQPNDVLFNCVLWISRTKPLPRHATHMHMIYSVSYGLMAHRNSCQIYVHAFPAFQSSVLRQPHAGYHNAVPIEASTSKYVQPTYVCSDVRTHGRESVLAAYDTPFTMILFYQHLPWDSNPRPSG